METPRKVIAAVDATETSAYAFTWALHNLIRKGDHVIVLTVAPYVGLQQPNYDLTGEYAIPMVTCTSSMEESVAEEKIVTAESSALVSKFLQQCAQAEISCEGEVVKGEPGSWIMDEAARISADIIVVGSHARGVIKRTILGSISDFVLHNVQCSVAIVRQSEALEIHDPLLSSGLARKIVVAVDDSKEAIHAFTWSLKNFCTPSDKVIIYHVRHPVVPPVVALGTGEFGMEDVYVPPDGNLKEDVDAIDESEKLVERYMEYAANESKIQCEGKVVTGPTEIKVCEGLISLKADAVIVGTHGRGVIARYKLYQYVIISM
ncbi:hypothetical protein O6H91_21G021100 [Diphasiastrum complanatum]|uniref:Uncharacterized protein n=1 Tax=Diphasiastrum complanatum TaxID=34168 RepID=A0ACC2AIK5_DIPCM|nr:hypothetical protein O6H91_21G021100 [Diphasiastrum complanatum]